MRLYLDTEFNGFGGDLISLALVSPPMPHPMASGGSVVSQWYETVMFKGPVDPWVKAHVIPVLDRAPLLPKAFKSFFHDFIRQFSNPEIICDWHADAAHFCQLLAGEDYGTSLDFPCRISILKTPPGHPVSGQPHNALADATALMEWYEAELAK